MKNSIYKIFFLFLFVTLSRLIGGLEGLHAQLTFQRTFQATGMNGGLSLNLTTDGGYVVCGQHESSGMGSCDFYVYKRDACGNTDFFNTYGDNFSQGGKSVKQTADGGFIVAGITQPTNAQDAQLMKLDAVGNLQWLQNYGNGNDWAMYAQQTTDGGYIMVGGTVTPAPYTWDVFMLKTDAVGIPQWSKVFVSGGEDFANYVEQTSDGGFFLSGYTHGIVNPNSDALAIKTDASGNVQWANVYAGTNHDGNARFDGLSLFSTKGHATPDGGYVISSSTRSFGVNDSADVWLVKLDANGNVMWNKTYGGNLNDESRDVHVTADNGFAIIGFTMSFGFGEQDVYLIKTDSLGNLQWSKAYGGSGRDKGESLTQSSIDHGYYIDGYSGSFSNFGTYLFDAYALKTDSTGFTGCNEMTPATVVGSGNPTVSPYPYTIAAYPTRPNSVYTQNSYNPNEYALCETLPPPDVAQFTNNTVCLGDSTVFTDFSTAGYGVVTEWLWDFGDGSPVDSTQNPVHTYTAAGTYSVSLVIHTTYSCIPDSTIQLVVVNPIPVPDFTAPNVCFNNPTNFTDLSTTATGTISNWNWNFGDGNTATGVPQSHTYNAAGTFTVTLIATNSFGCKDTIQKPVVVSPLPATSFVATTVCVGNQTCFTDLTTISSGTITSWSWNFADPNSGNNISNIQNPCHVFSAAGTYMVVLTATSDSACQTTVILPVLVYPLPVAGFTVPDQCLGTPNVFNNTSTGGINWDWDFGDNSPHSSQQNPSHTYAGYGNYVVTQIVTSAGGCKDTIQDTLTIYPAPIVNFSADTVCVGDTTSFFDFSLVPNGNIVSWLWNFGDGNTSTQQNPSHAYASSGTYNVTLTCTSNNGCVSTLQLSVLVHALPDAEFNYSPGPDISLVDAITFNDLSTGGVISWAWDLGDSTFSTAQNPVHVYGDTGTYVITLIVVNQYGCVDTVRHPLEIKDFAFYIPNCFTPNGDGNNQFFFGKGIGIIDYEMWIFDRWGNMIYYCHVYDLPQSPGCWWDGKVRGGTSNEIAQEDVYVWKCRFTSVFNKEYNYIGHVSIVK